MPKAAKKKAPRKRSKSRFIGAPETAGGDNTIDGMLTREEEAALSETLFDHMTDDSYVQVRRWRKGEAKPRYCFRLSMDQANEETIQRYAGGGKFLLRERQRDPQTGRFVWGRHRTIVIDGPEKEITDLPPGVEATPAPARSTAPEVKPVGVEGSVSLNDALVASIMNIMKSHSDASQMQLKAMEVFMMRMMQPQQQVNWLEMLPSILPPVVEYLKAKDTKQGPGPVEMLEKMSAIIANLKETTSPAQSFSEMVNTMNEVLDLKDRKAGEGDPMLEMGGRFLGVIEKMYQQKGRLPTEQELAAQVQQPKANPALPGGLPEWARLLTAFRKQLVAAAARDRDAETVASYVYEMMPETARGSVRELLSSEQVDSQVFGIVPELRQYSTWTGKFFQALADIYAEEEPEEEEEPEHEEPVREIP